MGFQDATGGGAEGFQKPWMPPRELPGESEPEFLRAARSSGKSTGSTIGVGTGSIPVGGATVGLPMTSQGGGAAFGGGFGGGPSSGNWAAIASAIHRGMFGGPGTRTGGSY